MTARSLISDLGIVSMILQLLRLSASISLKAPLLSEHLASARIWAGCSTVSSRRVVHAGLAHEVAEARALDTMAARCRKRKRSRGSHGEIITETKHGPCEQTRRICQLWNAPRQVPWSWRLSPHCTVLSYQESRICTWLISKRTITKIDELFILFAFVLWLANVDKERRRKTDRWDLPSDSPRTLRPDRNTRSSLRNAHNVDATHWKREQRNYISGLATGQRMTTRYSRREGAPLQEWAGGNEGCWATARPAAPPPAPSRDALAKSTSSLSLPLPPLRANTRPFVSLSPRPPTLRRRYSSFHPGQRCTSVLFFVISLLTLLSFLSPSPPNSCPSSIAFFYRIFYFSCRPCALHTSRAPSSRIFRLAPLTRHNASGDFYAGHGRLDIQADECARASVSPAMSLAMSLMRLPVFFTKCSQKKMACSLVDRWQ